MVSEYVTTFSTDAHTASRCADHDDVLSLSLNKESTKESQLKGRMPLRNPQDFLLGHTCRSWWHSVERCRISFYVFLLFLFEERHAAVSKGGSLWRLSWLLLGARQEVA